MRHPLGFILPEGCKMPAACRPDNPVYRRRLIVQRSPKLTTPAQPGQEAQAEGVWDCATCGRVKPQSDGDDPLTRAECLYLEAWLRRFDSLGRDP